MIDSLHRLFGYQIPRLGPVVHGIFRQLGPKRLDTELLPGIRANLDFTDSTQLNTWWQGRRFERPTCQIVEGWLAGADLFFDIGSNYGFFTWLALSTFPSIRGCAFEPHPKTFKLLQQIRQRNGLTERLSCWNIGLSDEEASLPLHPGTIDLGQTTFGDHPAFTIDPSLVARVRPFSEWRKENRIPLPSSPLWVAKIDVEGFEPRVLRGMEEELRAKAFRGLVVEMHAENLAVCGSTPEAIHSFMRSVGYIPLTGEICALLRRWQPGNAFFIPA